MTDDALGVDVGATNTKWVHRDADGTRLGEGSVPTPQGGPESVIETIGQIRERAGMGRVERIGVAVPGHVDSGSGRAILIPNLPGMWNGFPFGSQLRKRLGVRATIINDARAFGVAELSAGAAVGCVSAVFATVGTGIGGAIALNGRILRDSTDALGELGHTTVVRDGEVCGCGNHGCAEAYAGARSMTRRFHSDLEHPAALDENRDTALEHLRNAYDCGDPVAQRIVTSATWALACSITNVCVVLGVSTVVIGGGIGIRWPEFSVEIERQLRQRSAFVGRCGVRLSALGDMAGALGAALATFPRTRPKGSP